MLRGTASYNSAKGEANAILAIYHANRGDLSAADRFLGAAERYIYKAQPRDLNCQYQNQYQLNRVRAHIAYFAEDYERAAIRAEAALVSLNKQHAAPGACTNFQDQWRRPELHILWAKSMAAPRKWSAAYKSPRLA